jgi:hypothetical protein
MAAPARLVSWVEVSNRALIALGQSKIQALDEGTQAANYCHLFLEEAVNHVASYHPWRATRTRLELARDATTPVSGYDYRYVLPVDFLSISRDELGPMVGTENDNRGILWEIEGSYILTDAETIWIVYHRTPETPVGLPPAFVRAITYDLAARLCTILTSSTGLSTKIEGNLAQALRDAVAADSSNAHDSTNLADNGYRFPDEARNG